MVLGCRELAGVDSLALQCISQDGFPCPLRHQSPRWPEPTVLRSLDAVPVDQALEGGLRGGPLPQLAQLLVGPALPPRSMGGSKPLGVGVGVSVDVGVPGGVVGTGGSGVPRGVLVVPRPGDARGVGGAWAYADTWIHEYQLCLEVGVGPVAAAVVGHLLDMRGHRGLVWGR